MIAVFPDLEQLSHAAADWIAQQAIAVTRTGNPFRIALAGGRTPRRTYELLAAAPLRDSVPWQNVHVFWGDERFVPPDDERSNQCMVRHALLDHVPVPEAQVHPIDILDSPEASAQHYEDALRSHLGDSHELDLVLLGLGEDGHTASLFPGSHALGARNQWVTSAPAPDRKTHRVTMTAPLLNRARSVLFLVSGTAKAESLAGVLRGPSTPKTLPAQLIRPSHGQPRWFVDVAAAARLKRCDAGDRFGPEGCGAGLDYE